MPVRPLSVVLALGLSACANGPGGEAGSESETTGGDDSAWLDLQDGCTPTDWTSVDGDGITLVSGGQGLLMFGLPIRVGGVKIDTTITEWDDPNIPKLQFEMFADGHEYRPTGAMVYFANYPLRFTEVEDGVYEWVFLPVFVPDEVEDPQVLDGVEAHIELELRLPGRGIGGGEAITQAMDTTLRVNDPIDDDITCGVP